MPLEDREMKNVEVVDADITSLIAEGLFGELGAQSESKEQTELKVPDEAQSENTEEDADLPNAGIRLEKMKAQRDSDRAELSELKLQMAEFKGMISATKKEDIAEEDPTEYMDETQKALYNQHIALEKKYNELQESVGQFKIDKVRDTISKDENSFFDNNPDLQPTRQELVADMLTYLNDKPEITQLFRDQKVTMKEVHGMYQASKPKSTTKSEVKNPDKLFSGHSKSVPSEKIVNEISNNRKILSILNDKNSTNKADAVAAGIDLFASDFLT
tara:strand:+ start:5128 stop:5946 length:819 start_codon:yes stop_codon:yes gene_type:complete